MEKEDGTIVEIYHSVVQGTGGHQFDHMCTASQMCMVYPNGSMIKLDIKQVLRNKLYQVGVIAFTRHTVKHQ